MKRRPSVLVEGPRVPSSIQEQLAALRVAVGGHDVHCRPFVRVSRLKRRPAAEQNLRHLEVTLPDRQHKRCPPVGVSLVDEPPDLEVRLDIAQTSLSGGFMYVYLANRWLASRWLARLRGHFSSEIVRSTKIHTSFVVLGCLETLRMDSARAEPGSRQCLLSLQHTTYIA